MAGVICPAYSDSKSAKVTMKAETKTADDRSVVEEGKNRSFTAEKVVEKKSSEQLEWFKKGYEASINKKYDEAINYYNKAITLDPDYVDAHSNLGLIYIMKKMFDEAILELKRAIVLDPNHAGAHYNLGLAYDTQGENKKAIMEYEKTVEINPDFAAAHKNLGIAYLEKGLDAKAADSFYKAGLLFVEQGDEENAFNAYEGLITTKSLELEKALFEKLFPGRKKSTLEAEILKNIPLDDTPRDIKISTDGSSVYILCSKSLQIYSTQQNKVTGTIPLQGEFSQVAISPDGKQLFLANGTQKQISIIQITPSYDLAIGTSPVIGNADASVTVFAFLDYQ
jgi:tetratricopeptide (TPR) repeat protein